MKVELLEDYELLRRYDDELDEVYDTTIIGLPYATSRALKEVDPIAYREGYNNFLDDYLRENPGVLAADDAKEGVDYWTCPECGDAYDDETEANECCS